MPPIVNDFFDWLKDFSSSPWFYAIIFVIAVLDAVLPIVPSETMVIIGGVSAGAGQLEIALVIFAGALGAFTGDNLSYLIGRRASNWVRSRYTRTPSGEKKLNQVIDQIHERGGLLIVTARFIPGGRTVVTLSCGITRQPRPWFMKWTAIAAVIWANYAALLGFIGGKTFEDNHALAFGVAFGAAISVTIVIEAVRWFIKRRSNGSNGS
jgi:membrane protein DedA with SNARE-associated domain